MKNMNQNAKNEIDYRAEVLKVYPDADLYFNPVTDRYIIFDMTVGLLGIRDATCTEAAWQSAYETLKQQGKL